MTYRLWAGAALLFAVLASPLQADLIISFTPDGTPKDTFEVVVGQTVDVPIYVFQVDGDPVLTGTGLISAGVQVRYANTGTNATVTNQELASHWDGFSDYQTGTDATSPYAWMVGYRDLAGDPVKGMSVLIGKVTFQGNVVGDHTVVTTMDIDVDFPAIDIIVDANGGGHDADVFSQAMSTTIITTAVPEPSSIALAFCGLTMMGLVVWRKKRRHTVA